MNETIGHVDLHSAKNKRMSSEAQYTPLTPTRLNCRVESRRRCERTRRQS